MLDRLFRLGFDKQRSAASSKRPPTERQLAYAKKLGIQVTPDMDLYAVSAAISAHPTVIEQNRQAELEWRAEIPSEELAHYDYWQTLEKPGHHLLMVFRRGKSIVVDVAEIDRVDVDEKNRCIVSILLPKVYKERGMDPCIEWEKEVDLKPVNILHHEPLGEIDLFDTQTYRLQVERGLKIAAAMA